MSSSSCSSLPFSLGCYTPEKFNASHTRIHTELLFRNSHSSKAEAEAPSSSSHVKLSSSNHRSASELSSWNLGLIGRRQGAIGFLGYFSFLISQADPSIAADEGGSRSCDEFTVAPSGLAFCDKVVGDGPQAVKGQLIKAHYVGKLENGTVFDSSYNRGKPLTFRVGVGEVIKGWDQGIAGSDGVPPMLAGGKRVLKIPPELGYGTRGAGCRGGSCIIPPNSVLVFNVEFIGKAA